MESSVLGAGFARFALAIPYLLFAAGCAFYEPPQTVYTARPDEVLAQSAEEASGAATTAPPSEGTPRSGFEGRPGTVPNTPGLTEPGPTTANPGTPAPQMPQFEPVEPAVLQDRLAAIAEALAKYVSQHEGKLPEFTSGGSFRSAIVALMQDESAWPAGTMIVPRAISGMKLDQIPNRSETPLIVAGPLGTDGRRYAVFADLTVKVVPEQEPVAPPRQPSEVPPTGVDF